MLSKTARARVGESEGRWTDGSERAWRVSHAHGAGCGAPARARVGESEGRSPSENKWI